MVDHLQRQAPVVFGFLPTPPVVNFAKEASRLYDDYLQAVRAETLSTLLTLPQPYERPLPPGASPRLSTAAVALLAACPAVAGAAAERAAGSHQAPRPSGENGEEAGIRESPHGKTLAEGA
jgi:hypothetical protein